VSDQVRAWFVRGRDPPVYFWNWRQEDHITTPMPGEKEGRGQGGGGWGEGGARTQKVCMLEHCSGPMLRRYSLHNALFTYTPHARRHRVHISKACVSQAAQECAQCTPTTISTRPLNVKSGLQVVKSVYHMLHVAKSMYTMLHEVTYMYNMLHVGKYMRNKYQCNVHVQQAHTAPNDSNDASADAGLVSNGEIASAPVVTGLSRVAARSICQVLHFCTCVRVRCQARSPVKHTTAAQALGAVRLSRWHAHQGERGRARRPHERRSSSEGAAACKMLACAHTLFS